MCNYAQVKQESAPQVKMEVDTNNPPPGPTTDNPQPDQANQPPQQPAAPGQQPAEQQPAAAAAGAANGGSSAQLGAQQGGVQVAQWEPSVKREDVMPEVLELVQRHTDFLRASGTGQHSEYAPHTPISLTQHVSRDTWRS